MEIVSRGQSGQTRGGVRMMGMVVMSWAAITLVGPIELQAAESQAATQAKADANQRGSVLVKRTTPAATREAVTRVAEATNVVGKGQKTGVAKTSPKPAGAKSSVMIRRPAKNTAGVATTTAPKPIVVAGPNLVPQAAGTVDASDSNGSRREQRRSRRSRRGR